MKIVVDAMGGDNAPEQIVKGCLLAAEEYGVNIILCGREQEIKKHLDKNANGFKYIDILNAEEIITNEDSPTMAIRRKKDSSIVKALTAVKNNEADGIISAGSTGAYLTGAFFIIGCIDGIKRPALAPLVPNMKSFSLLLDAGANADCKPEYLYDFAIMGDVYMQQVMNIVSPRIGLANVGSEKGKGNKLTKEVYELLENSTAGFNFTGNIEARDILRGQVDVIVCDGFTGNMLLKSIEGTAAEFMEGMKEELMSDMRSKIGAALVKPALRKLKKRFDASEYGGAPLLGVKVPVIKAHGNSNDIAIKNAVRQTKLFIENEVNNKIQENIMRR